jgi:hypothetical protein
MSFWLPVVFICLSGGNCGFANGSLKATASQCEATNYAVRQKLATDLDVASFKLGCIEIKKDDFI